MKWAGPRARAVASSWSYLKTLVLRVEIFILGFSIYFQMCIIYKPRKERILSFYVHILINYYFLDPLVSQEKGLTDSSIRSVAC